MHFKMSSAICFNLDQSKILSSGNGLTVKQIMRYFQQAEKRPKEKLSTQVSLYRLRRMTRVITVCRGIKASIDIEWLKCLETSKPIPKGKRERKTTIKNFAIPSKSQTILHVLNKILKKNNAPNNKATLNHYSTKKNPLDTFISEILPNLL